MSEATQKRPGLSMLLDYGPLLAFFLSYKLAGSGLQGTLVATFVFMVAVIVAIAIGLAVLKRVSPMIWISTVLIIGFGGLTLYLRDPRFIQMKPTAVYLFFGLALLIGLLRKKPLLRWAFGPIFPGLTDEGWMKLTRNWAIFFLVMAGVNEVLRATLSFDTWLTVKVWGMTAISLIFTFANIPMLLRHGLDLDDAKAAVEETPVE